MFPFNIQKYKIFNVTTRGLSYLFSAAIYLVWMWNKHIGLTRNQLEKYLKSDASHVSSLVASVVEVFGSRDVEATESKGQTTYKRWK